MKKYFLFSLLIAIIPNMVFGASARYTQLVREKQRKMEQLEKCMGTSKGLKIAGISTLGLTAVGVAGNIAEAKIIKDNDATIEKNEKKIEKKQQEIAEKQKEIDNKKAAEEKKAEEKKAQNNNLETIVRRDIQAINNLKGIHGEQLVISADYDPTQLPEDLRNEFARGWQGFIQRCHALPSLNSNIKSVTLTDDNAGKYKSGSGTLDRKKVFETLTTKVLNTCIITECKDGTESCKSETIDENKRVETCAETLKKVMYGIHENRDLNNKAYYEKLVRNRISELEKISVQTEVKLIFQNDENVCTSGQTYKQCLGDNLIKRIAAAQIEAEAMRQQCGISVPESEYTIKVEKQDSENNTVLNQDGNQNGNSGTTKCTQEFLTAHNATEGKDCENNTVCCITKCKTGYYTALNGTPYNILDKDITCEKNAEDLTGKPCFNEDLRELHASAGTYTKVGTDSICKPTKCINDKYELVGDQCKEKKTCNTALGKMNIGETKYVKSKSQCEGVFQDERTHKNIGDDETQFSMHCETGAKLVCKAKECPAVSRLFIDEDGVCKVKPNETIKKAAEKQTTPANQDKSILNTQKTTATSDGAGTQVQPEISLGTQVVNNKDLKGAAVYYKKDFSTYKATINGVEFVGSTSGVSASPATRNAAALRDLKEKINAAGYTNYHLTEEKNKDLQGRVIYYKKEFSTYKATVDGVEYTGRSYGVSASPATKDAASLKILKNKLDEAGYTNYELAEEK